MLLSLVFVKVLSGINADGLKLINKSSGGKIIRNFSTYVFVLLFVAGLLLEHVIIVHLLRTQFSLEYLTVIKNFGLSLLKGNTILGVVVLWNLPQKKAIIPVVFLAINANEYLFFVDILHIDFGVLRLGN